MGISVSAWSLGSKAIPRIPSWKEYIRKELKPVIDNSKREMLDWGQMNVTQFSLDAFHTIKQVTNWKNYMLLVKSEENIHDIPSKHKDTCHDCSLPSQERRSLRRL